MQIVSILLALAILLTVISFILTESNKLEELVNPQWKHVRDYSAVAVVVLAGVWMYQKYGNSSDAATKFYDF